jgi:alpha-beta hydrolase superfamily lysophospholipase
MDQFISNFRWNERTVFIFLGTTVAAIAFGIVSRSQASRPKLVCSSESLYLKPFPGETFEENIITINGGKRNTAKWLPADKAPKAVVIIVHGLHEHVLNYYAVAHELTAKGYAVYGMDHVGHGLSGDVRGLVPDYELLVSDLVAFTESVQKLHPTLPTFLLAHSMGTLVTILACKKLTNIKVVIVISVPYLLVH